MKDTQRASSSQRTDPMPRRRVSPTLTSSLLADDKEAAGPQYIPVSPASVLPKDDEEFEEPKGINPVNAATFSTVPLGVELAKRVRPIMASDVPTKVHAPPVLQRKIGEATCVCRTTDTIEAQRQRVFNDGKKVAKFVGENKEAILCLLNDCYLCEKPLLGGFGGGLQMGADKVQEKEVGGRGEENSSVDDFGIVSWTCSCKTKHRMWRLTHCSCLREKINMYRKTCDFCNEDMQTTSALSTVDLMAKQPCSEITERTKRLNMERLLLSTSVDSPESDTTKETATKNDTLKLKLSIVGVFLFYLLTVLVNFHS